MGEQLSESELTGQMTCVPATRDFGIFEKTGVYLSFFDFRVLIFGAQDTTSSALSRILHLLAMNPHIQDKVIPQFVNLKYALNLNMHRFGKKLLLLSQM